MVAVMLLALVLPGACASSSSESGYITVGLAPVANFDALYAYNTVPGNSCIPGFFNRYNPIDISSGNSGMVRRQQSKILRTTIFVRACIPSS